MTLHNYQINTAADPYAQPMADVQAQIARVDTKASILFGFALAALTGGTAIISKVHLPLVASGCAVIAAAFIAAALVLLGLAIRPNLGGNYGFLRWASASSKFALRKDLHAYSDTEDRVEHLWLMARVARTKYQYVRVAVDLLGVALAIAFFTAGLTGAGW